jgi:penicillin-insensitive murein endopeptidase
MKSILLIILLVIATVGKAETSACYGTTSKGRLENGIKLPSKGRNFVAYGTIPQLTGRTYVHSKVRDVVIAAYQELETSKPNKIFKYAETGFEQGGSFKPHKTHQNGLSIDFMVPVVNKDGESVHLPTHMLNKYGYDIEFDSEGKYKDYHIDFDAIGAHIVAMHKAADKHGVGLWRVLFDPQMQVYLYKTQYGDYIRENIEIPNKRSWVRHDEHYHVDFIVQCKTM